MTVTRKVTELLNIPTVDICDHIKQVLSDKERFYSYINTIKNDDAFEATVKPIGCFHSVQHFSQLFYCRLTRRLHLR
ncbi:MAG: hypothetical protein MJK15_09810 [Colwellia sp.]|nr:hypothetical protein [Colwellia sp.]